MGTTKLIQIYPKVKYLAITWQVSDHCNYKCSYCNEGNWGGNSKNDGETQTYINNLKTIVDRYKDAGYEAFKIYLSGGEPTIWKNLLPVASFFKEYSPNNTVAINTNLSQSTKWWNQHHDLFDDVVASFHIEQVNKKRYLSNSLLLCERLNYFCNKMLMHEDKFWEVVEYGEMLKQTMPSYNIEWTPLFDEMSGNAKPWEYKDPAKVEWLENHQQLDTKHGPNKFWKESQAISIAEWSDGTKNFVNSNEIIVKRQNFFSGWTCDIGDAIFINPVGMISMASCGVKDVVGHILYDISNIKPQNVVCNKYHCVCGTDIIIPKRP